MIPQDPHYKQNKTRNKTRRNEYEGVSVILARKPEMKGFLGYTGQSL